jgi:hypothetical protein
LEYGYGSTFEAGASHDVVHVHYGFNGHKMRLDGQMLMANQCVLISNVSDWILP